MSDSGGNDGSSSLFSRMAKKLKPGNSQSDKGRSPQPAHSPAAPTARSNSGSSTSGASSKQGAASQSSPKAANTATRRDGSVVVNTAKKLEAASRTSGYQQAAQTFKAHGVGGNSSGSAQQSSQGSNTPGRRSGGDVAAMAKALAPHSKNSPMENVKSDFTAKASPTPANSGGNDSGGAPPAKARALPKQSTGGRGGR